MRARVDTPRHEIQVPRSELVGKGHLAAANQTRDVLGTIGDFILHREHFQEIPPLNGEKQSAREMQSQIALEVVRLVLEHRDLLLRRVDGIQVASDHGLEQWQ